MFIHKVTDHLSLVQIQGFFIFSTILAHIYLMSLRDSSSRPAWVAKTVSVNTN